MLRFGKETSEKSRNWKNSRYLSNFKFSKVICGEIWLKFKLTWIKNLFVGIYHEKKEGSKHALSPCKIELAWISTVIFIE